MKRRPLLFICTILLLPLCTWAGNTDSLRGKVSQWMSANSGVRFLENKGQMYDEERKPVPNVLYEASGGGMNVYITTSGLSYVFTKYNKFKKKNTSPIIDKHHQPDSVTINYCRADMQLVGASIQKENITQEGESTDRSDYYYGGICPDGILNVHSYTKITIKNIYPGIDWVLHGSKKGLKYDFIVHPGADPSQIKLHYKWTDAPQLQADGSIKITTPMGTITEGTPASFSNNAQVATSYIIKDTNISFKVDDYNTTQTLIIDPKLVWATYYATETNENDDAWAMNEDGDNVWITGYSLSTHFPTLNPQHGAYFQGSLAGIGNIFILKFNIEGVLKWATYYGGNTADEAKSIYSDGRNVWVTGDATSTNFPTFNPGGGAYFQGTFIGGNYTAYILKFDTSGERKWATYYGGYGSSLGDFGYSIQSDGKNVWLTGSTNSTNFPTFNPGGGAYFQGILASTYGDAFILQFDTSGVRKWATYYGGNAINSYLFQFANIGNSIYCDGKNVWLAGYTTSSSFPTFNPGGGAYFQGSLAGSQDAFILKFNINGVCKWATYYGGNDMYAIDGAYGINSDGRNVWVTGMTGSTDFPTFNPGGGAYFQGTLGTTISSNAFILKFDTAGITKWATYYGGNGVMTYRSETGFSIENDGANIWVCGAASSTNFPTLSPGCGFYRDTFGILGYNDIFIAQFSNSGVRKWSTYYAVDNEDDASGVWSDGRNLFIAGDAGRSDYPTIDPGGGAYYVDTLTGVENVIVGKFIVAGVKTNSVPPICRGDSATLQATGAAYYNWSPPRGLSATNISDPKASPVVTTTYTVTGIDTEQCGGTFIDSVTVVVDTLGKIKISNDTTICLGSSVKLYATGGTTYNWSNADTTNSIYLVHDSVSKTYSVTISNGACKTDTSVKVTVKPLPKPAISGRDSVCQGLLDILAASGGITYVWNNGSKTPTYYTGKIYSDSTFTVTVYDSLGCHSDTTFVVKDIPFPKPKIYGDTIICSGQQEKLEATGGFRYEWNNGTTGNVYSTGAIEADSTITLTAYNSLGCSHDTSITITPAVPLLSACCNATIEPGTDTTLVAIGDSKLPYQWSPTVTCLNPICDSVKASPTVTTTYTVSETDSLGCTVERVVTIMVEKTCFNFAVPNVFTPDYAATGLNNLFYIKTENVDVWSINIYDRWGKEMFHTTNPTQYWDGTTEGGSKAPAGVYYYIINATCQNTTYKKDGFVQLIR